jgi:hypothetical protein
MAKKQQMRWTHEKAHYLAQISVAVLNEEFSVKKLAVLIKTYAAANSRSGRRAARIDLPRFGSLSETHPVRLAWRHFSEIPVRRFCLAKFNGSRVSLKSSH